VLRRVRNACPAAPITKVIAGWVCFRPANAALGGFAGGGCSVLLLEEFIRAHAPLAPIEGCQGLVAHQCLDLERAWEIRRTSGPPATEPPYWALVWPAGAHLARWLLDHPELVRGKRVLDLGCGGGIAAIGAARAGAMSVLANDVDPEALVATRMNAAANGAHVDTECRDRVAAHDLGGFDVVLAADVLYQSPTAPLVLAALRSTEALVLLADAGRATNVIIEGTLLHEERVTVARDLEGVGERVVRLYRW
jgi:predicted nicotinamide N-methyase